MWLLGEGRRRHPRSFMSVLKIHLTECAVTHIARSALSGGLRAGSVGGRGNRFGASDTGSSNKCGSSSTTGSTSRSSCRLVSTELEEEKKRAMN
jgi:hypothetical protein